MKFISKAKMLILLTLVLIFLLPSFAYAKGGFDEYGYNKNAHMFVGTLENWDNFLYGRPSEPYESNQTDTIYCIRKWNKSFDNSMFQGEPWIDGAWCRSYLYQHLSGAQAGWTWHYLMKLEYSSTPIIGAIPVAEMPNFYLTTNIEWLTDPDGNETIITNTHIKNGYVPLHGFGPINGHL